MTIAGYLRISDEDKDLKRGVKTESDSIAGQRRIILDFIGKMEEFEGADVVEYCDM